MFFWYIISVVVVPVIAVVAVIRITIIGVVIGAFYTWTSSKSRVTDVVRSVNIARLVTNFCNHFMNLMGRSTNFSAAVVILLTVIVSSS